MNLSLVRSGNGLGKLYIDGVFQCDTLEDLERPMKIPGETAIPKGTYKVVIDQSVRFKRLMPHVLDVPGFTGIRIHSGNTQADTEGCILVGEKYTDKPPRIINSRIAFAAFFAKLQSALNQNSQVTLEIK